jgi:hypothetical protein
MAIPPIPLRILGYRESGEWVALALEMDLRGHGGTFEEALADLRDLVLMQIGFATFKSQPGMIWKNAEPVWFSQWENARSERLVAFIGQRKVSQADTEVAELSLPDPSVISEQASKFSPVDA